MGIWTDFPALIGPKGRGKSRMSSNLTPMPLSA
jgi:hypothetical protein